MLQHMQGPEQRAGRVQQSHMQRRLALHTKGALRSVCWQGSGWSAAPLRSQTVCVCAFPCCCVCPPCGFSCQPTPYCCFIPCIHTVLGCPLLDHQQAASNRTAGPKQLPQGHLRRRLSGAAVAPDQPATVADMGPAKYFGHPLLWLRKHCSQLCA
jgi:hypothetical protein